MGAGEQARELDPKKREAILHRIQQLIHDKVMVPPDFPWSAPYEDLKLKAR